VDVLRERGDAPAPIVDRLERAAIRAQEDVEALLAMSPAREPSPPVNVDLRELLPRAADPYLREEATRARVVWSWGAASVVRAEPAALSIVFTNLLRNALRAAPQGEIRIDASDREVAIVDDGEGFPQTPASAGEPRGRGMGLMIARTLAERHAWRLTLEPAHPRGTRASLKLASS
jgi:signal transduction histidine kinase